MKHFRDYIKEQDFKGAMEWVDAVFESDPRSSEAAYYFSHLMLECDHPGPAMFILEELAKRHPEKWQALQHLGKCYEDFELLDEAEDTWKKALEMHPDAHGLVVGLSSIYTNQQRWDLAEEYSLKALSMGESLQAEVNLAFVRIANKDFGVGWDLYSKGVGHMTWRDKHDYGLKDWDGGEGKVLFYGEQGLGDQIAFCSAIPEAIASGTAVALNTTPKLVNLFKDNFDIPVHGGQFTREVPWLESTGATHQAPMSDLMRYYRRDADSFSGKPFLKANPEKSFQWKALLDKECKDLRVGISWTGGKKKSHAWKRKGMSLDSLNRFLKIDGVSWICLEYKDREAEIAHVRKEDGLIIRNWPWGTQTSDYSDTAALVENLDMLITVPTSVNHLAGAMGKEVHCLVHDKPHFHYASGMPYYSSVNLHNRDEEGFSAVEDALLNLLRAKEAA